MGREINHPDHIVMYTWRTLSTLMERTGWQVTESATYIAEVKETEPANLAERAMVFGAKAALGAEKLLSRAGAHFMADGLIISAVPNE